MRQLGKLDKTINTFEELLKDKNKLMFYIHAGTAMNALEHLKTLKHLNEHTFAQGIIDIDGVPHCGSCGWVESWGCNYCDNCGKPLKWE